VYPGGCREAIYQGWCIPTRIPGLHTQEVVYPPGYPGYIPRVYNTHQDTRVIPHQGVKGAPCCMPRGVRGAPCCMPRGVRGTPVYTTRVMRGTPVCTLGGVYPG